MNEFELVDLEKDGSPQCGDLIQKIKPRRISDLSLFALALPVSACGGGGGIKSAGETTSTPSLQAPSSSTTFTSAPSGTVLSLAKTNSGYTSSMYSGVSLLGNKAHMLVADDKFDNEYAMKLSAEGSGVIEFEFEDPSDTITLLSGSIMDGFSQLNVTNGTVDASAADLGDVEKVVVASGLKITYSQITSLKSIVSNSATSVIEVAVTNDEEAKALEEFISSGAIELYLAEGAPPIAIKETVDAAVSPAVLTSVIGASGGAAAAAPAPTSAVLAPPQQMTKLAEKSAASLLIINDDGYVNETEAASAIRFHVELNHGYTVKTLSVGGILATATGVENEFQISASNLSQGEVAVVLTVQDPIAAISGASTQGGLVTLQGNIVVDTLAPSNASINIEGGSNGLNNSEANDNVRVTILTPNDAVVGSVKLDGNALQSLGGNVYNLDASDLQDGNYEILAEIVDSAGNSAQISKALTIDKTSPSEPVISIPGADNGLNAIEISSPIIVDVDLNGAQALQSANVNGQALNTTSATAYTLNASTLPEGVNTITVNALDASGDTVTSQLDFIVDTIAPSPASIVVSGSQFGLTDAERVDPVSVFVTNEPSSSVVSANFSGGALSQSADGVYSFNGRSLSPGQYDISVTLIDGAGNTSQSSEEIIVLGTTNAISNAFDVQSSVESDIVSISLYIKNALEQFPNGIPTYSFDIQLNAAQLDYIEGSFQGFEGSSFEVGESASSEGLIRVSGMSGAPFQDYDTPFMVFQADIVEEVDTTQITLSDVIFYRTDYGDVDYFTSI